MKTFEPQQVTDLMAPLNKANVKERTQAGRQLSYVEAWWAISEANRIFGFGNWDRETVDLRQLGDPRLTDGKYRVGYSARVRITVRAGEGVILREGCGFGSGIDKDPDQAHESALKEAESDAMKRALMTFGNPFGLALYDKTQANVVSAPANAPASSGGRKTPAQAKRDGDHEKYTKEIDALDNAGCLDWLERFDEYTADAPVQWLDPLRDRLELRREELMKPPANAAEQEFDEGFRGAVGPRSNSVAGRVVADHAEAGV